MCYVYMGLGWLVGLKFNPHTHQNGERTMMYWPFHRCIAGSAHTYKVQEGHDGIGTRKEGTIIIDMCVRKLKFNSQTQRKKGKRSCWHLL